MFIIADIPKGWSAKRAHRVYDAAIEVEIARLEAVETTAFKYDRWLRDGYSDYLGYREQDAGLRSNPAGN